MATSTKYSLFTLAVLVCAFVNRSPGQGLDIRGVVSDSATGQRIPFANVVVLNTSWGASTNNVGFYLIPNLPPGEYDIAASVIGYERRVHHVAISRGKAITLDFQLTARPVENPEVLVTGAREIEVSQIAASLHLVEQKDVKLVPAMVQEDVFQSLKMLPGIISTNDVSSRFFVRGGAADQNLILLDGLKIFSPFHTMGLFSVFDPDIVQNVELSTGAFPPEYGGRLSSVVNITSRDGRSDRVAARGSLNLLSSKLQIEGPAIGGTSWLINARKSVFSDAFRRMVNQDIPVSFYDLFSKFGAKFPGGAKLDFSFLFASDKLNLYQSYQRFGRMQASQVNYRWRTTAASGSYSNLVGDRVFVQLSVYYSGYQANRDSNAARTPSSTSNTIKEFGLRGLGTYYTNSRDLCMFGFDFGFPTINYKLVNLAGKPLEFNDSYVNGIAWFRYQAHLGRWLLDVGIHDDFGSLVAGEAGLQSLQPRVDVSYELDGNWKVKWAIGSCSQRIVTLNNEDEVMSIFDVWIKIPAKLPVQKANHVILGLNGNVNDATSLKIESYFKNYTSLFIYNRNKRLAGDPDYITGTGHSYGAEALLRTRVWGIDLYGAYALSWTRIDDGSSEYYPQYDRRHNLNLLATAHPLTDMDVTLRWAYGSGLPYTASLGYYDRLMLGGANSTPFQFESGAPYLALGTKNAWRLPPYHRLDASITYKLAIRGMKGILEGQITNVYDNVNIFYFDRTTGVHTDMLRFFPSVSFTLEY